MKASPDFIEELKSSLPKSTFEQRKNWAIFILKNKISLKELFELLKCDKKIATRFLWTISDIGILNPKRLSAELPDLFKFCNSLNNQEYKTSFASFGYMQEFHKKTKGKQ